MRKSFSHCPNEYTEQSSMMSIVYAVHLDRPSFKSWLHHLLTVQSQADIAILSVPVSFLVNGNNNLTHLEELPWG